MISAAIWQDVLVGGLGYTAGLLLGVAFLRGEISLPGRAPISPVARAAHGARSRGSRSKRPSAFSQLLADRLSQVLALGALGAVLLGLGYIAYFLATV